MTKETPLVSVIMNCYNGEKYLKEAIDSVYAQTYQNWEIIFWDNASTDRTEEIAKTYDEKLKYFRSKKTTVLGKARVEATKKAVGEYMAFLDVDDLWIEDKLEKQVSKFINSDQKTGFVYGRSRVIFDDKRKGYVVKDGETLPESDVFKELIKGNSIVFSSVMVHREKFYDCGGFPENFLNSPDYWILLQMAREYKCCAVQEVCCENRIHESNLSKKQQVIGAQEAIKALMTMISDQRVSAGLKGHYANLAVMYFKEKKIMRAIILLVKNGGWYHILQRILKLLGFNQ